MYVCRVCAKKVTGKNFDKHLLGCSKLTIYEYCIKYNEHPKGDYFAKNLAITCADCIYECKSKICNKFQKIIGKCLCGCNEDVVVDLHRLKYNKTKKYCRGHWAKNFPDQINKNRCGRSYTEFYGEEIAYQIRKKMSRYDNIDILKLECQTCHTIFERPHYKYQKYCSNSCRGIAATQIKKDSKFYKYGHVYSEKAGKVFYRSYWEKLFIEHLEQSYDVITFKHEPFTIPYEWHGIKRYLIDFIVYYKNCIKIIEVKPAYQLKEKKVQCKIEAAHKYALKHGLIFEVWTEREFNLHKIFINYKDAS